MAVEMTSRTIIEKLYTNELKPAVEELRSYNAIPHLGIVLVGHDPNSLTYIAVKQREAEKLGIEFSLHRLDESASEEAVLGVIEQLNNEKAVSGIIVQLPLPSHLNTDTILQAVAKEKDVDGLRSPSEFNPPTVQAIIELLEAYDVNVSGKRIVLVGKGRLVGSPLLKEFEALKLDVVACDKSTEDLAEKTVEADILISATGEHHLIKPHMVKNGAIIIDVDHEVDYELVVDKVAAITPQKGAVGPLTVAFLLSNVILAAQEQLIKEKNG